MFPRPCRFRARMGFSIVWGAISGPFAPPRRTVLATDARPLAGRRRRPVERAGT